MKTYRYSKLARVCEAGVLKYTRLNNIPTDRLSAAQRKTSKKGENSFLQLFVYLFVIF